MEESYLLTAYSYFKDAFSDAQPDDSESPSLRAQLSGTNVSNAEFLSDSISEGVSERRGPQKANDYDKILQKEIQDRQLENLIGRLEHKNCCLYVLICLIKYCEKLCCSFTPKIYLKKPTSWRKPMRKFDASSLMRENYLGIISGIAIGFLAFILFTMTFAHAMHIATLASCYVMLLAVFGIAFSEDVRCVFMLVLPYLAASRTRWLLMLCATGLTTMGPGINFLHNTGNFRNAIGCVMGQVTTNMKMLTAITKAPVRLIKGQIHTFVDGINGKMESIRQNIDKIKRSVYQLSKVMNTKNSWIKTMIQSCGDETSLKNQCLAFFNTLYFSCTTSMQTAHFLCNIVRVFAEQACNGITGMKEICDRQAKKLNSHILENAVVSEEDLMDSEAALLRFIGSQNITLEEDDKLIDLDISSSLSTHAEVTKLIKNKMDGFVNWLNFVKAGMRWILVLWTLVTVVQLVLQAALFRRKWLLKNHFDNNYITSAFIRQERWAFENGLPNTLPMSFGERSTYVALSSIWWSKGERRSAFASFLFLIIALSSLIFVIVADYAMYYALETTAPAFSASFGTAVESMLPNLEQTSNVISELGNMPGDDISPNIEGNSSFAKMGRSFLALANPLKDVAFDVDASLCRPTGSLPDGVSNITIVVIIGFTLLTIVLQVYIMRLRHIILIWYYPIRASERASWLRTYIRNSRGLFHRVVHRFRTRDRENMARTQTRLPWSERFLFTNPVLSGYLRQCGLRREYCAYCGDYGNPSKKSAFKQKFTQCEQCGSYFCALCQVDLKHVCLFCRVPLCKTILDLDLERISSDEEYEYFHSKFLRRAEHENFKLAEKAPAYSPVFDKRVGQQDEKGRDMQSAPTENLRKEIPHESVQVQKANKKRPTEEGEKSEVQVPMREIEKENKITKGKGKAQTNLDIAQKKTASTDKRLEQKSEQERGRFQVGASEEQNLETDEAINMAFRNRPNNKNYRRLQNSGRAQRENQSLNEADSKSEAFLQTPRFQNFAKQNELIQASHKTKPYLVKQSDFKEYDFNRYDPDMDANLHDDFDKHTYSLETFQGNSDFEDDGNFKKALSGSFLKKRL